MPTKKAASKKSVKLAVKVVNKIVSAVKKASSSKKEPEAFQKNAYKNKSVNNPVIKKRLPAPKNNGKVKPDIKPALIKSEVKLTNPLKNSKVALKAVHVAPAIIKKAEIQKEVKVPKTTVKTSVPYHPEYKMLDQRQEPNKPSVPLIRYTDTELSEFRDLINKKLDAAKKELGYLQGLITRKDDMGGGESEARYMTMEDGSISMEREQLSQMASRQITYIDHLEKALIRIESKTYGICRVTGRLIDKARLRAVPHATLSLEAKLGIVKAGNE